MNVEIEVKEDPDGTELAALWRWLTTQRELAGRVTQVQGEIGEQDLGGGIVEVLSVAVGSGGIATVLASSLGTWLSTRQRTIKISVGDTIAEFPTETDPQKLAQYFAAIKGEESHD